MAWRRAGWQRLFIALLLVFVLADGFLGVLLPIQIPEVRANPDVASVQLWIDGFASWKEEWVEHGSSPWLDSQDQPSNYVEANSGSKYHGNWTFQDLPADAQSVINATLYFYLDTTYAASNFHIRVYLYNGSGWYEPSGDVNLKSAGWAWKSCDVSEYFSSVESVNQAKMYIKSSIYAGSYPQKLDAAYLLVYYEIEETPPLSYSNLSPENNYVSQPEESITFSAYWTANNGNLSHYIFSYKIGEDGAWTNETYSFPEDVSEAWSNVTKNVDDFSDSEGKWIYWKFYANNTAGNWKATEERRVFHWESLPPVSRFVDGKSVVSGTRHIYYNGSKEAIYVVYLNTSYSPWKYQIRCFDMESYQWIGPFNISDAPESDTHYKPSISVLPDGRLIILYGYYTKLKFRISTYSANTESNLTKLCSNWSQEYEVSLRWSSKTSYPEAVRTENYTLVFARDGASVDGDWTFWRFAVNNWVYSYVGSFSNSTYEGTWNFVGSSPYVDEYGEKGDSYMEVTAYDSHYAKIGNFTFRAGWAENIDSTVYLEILAESQEASLCTSWNTTWKTVSGNTPTWLSWKVTGKKWSDTLEYIRVFSADDNPTKIYCVRLKLNITGFSPAYAFIQGDPSCYFFRPRRFGDKIIVYGRKQQGGVGRYNHYFVYSDDEGFTWKVANGTEVKFPLSLSEIKAVDIGGINHVQVVNKGGIIYNNTAVFLALPYNTHYKNWSHPLTLIYYNNLGSPTGSWHTVNATFENGSLIWIPSGFHWYCNFILDEYYERPSVWFVTGEKVVKAVALPNNFTVYRIVYEDTEYATGVFSLIHESPEAYEVAGENMLFLLGYSHIGENDQNMTNTMAYGCKFNASQSGYLTRIYLYESPFEAGTAANVMIKAAVYNATYDLLATSDEIQWVSGSTRYAWSYPITFPNPPYLEENKTYWIVWKVSATDMEGNPLRYAYTTGLTNQTIHFPNSYSDPFPSHINLSQATFYNRKISVFGGEMRLVVRGLGHDIYPPYPSNIGVEGSPQPNHQVVFHTYWTDNSHLDYAVFYWNASGSMTQNGTLDWADNPTEAWSNFTRTLPDVRVIAWYIVAYDVYGNSGNTTVQILVLADWHVLVYDFSLNTRKWSELAFNFTLDVMKWNPLSYSFSLDVLQWHSMTFPFDLSALAWHWLTFPFNLECMQWHILSYAFDLLVKAWHSLTFLFQLVALQWHQLFYIYDLSVYGWHQMIFPFTVDAMQWNRLLYDFVAQTRQWNTLGFPFTLLKWGEWHSLAYLFNLQTLQWHELAYFFNLTVLQWHYTIYPFTLDTMQWNILNYTFQAITKMWHQLTFPFMLLPWQMWHRLIYPFEVFIPGSVPVVPPSLPWYADTRLVLMFAFCLFFAGFLMKKLMLD